MAAVWAFVVATLVAGSSVERSTGYYIVDTFEVFDQVVS